MINKAWSLRPLGELFEIGAGKTMSAAARDGAHKTAFLRTSNVLWDEIDLTAVDQMAIPPHELSEKLLRPGDLLVCEGGEIGRAALWGGETEIMSFQNHLHRLRAIRRDVEPRFYVYFLQSAFTQLGIFEGAGNKTTIPNLSRNRLAALEVPHPSLDEQRKVSLALARVRDAIRTHRGSMATVQDLKRVAMRQLFTRGLKGERQKQTEIGPVPESWKVAPLREFFQIKHGFAFNGANFRSEGEFVLLTPGHFSEEGGFRHQGDKTKFYVGKFDPEYLLPPASLLIAMTEQKQGLLGSSAIIPDARLYLHNQRLGLVTHLNEQCLAKRYLYHLLNYRAVRDEISRTSTGSKVKHTSPDRILDVVAPIPNLDEQAEIADLLDTIDRKSDLHVRKHAGLEELFQSLLHKLLTGEICVADLNLPELEANAAVKAAA